MTPGQKLDGLISIMNRLRDPGGCPWDAKQTMTSLQPYLVEEAYELLTAMEEGDREAQRDELGDVLLQVVFQSRIASEEQHGFDMGDVIQFISDKMVRRHPHVFGDASVDGAEGVENQWEQIKRREKRAAGERARSVVDGIPPSAPALLRAARLGEKAQRVGLDWPDLSGVRRKVSEELAEVDEALALGDLEAIADELGDLLFTVAQLARHAKVEPELALRAATRKFTGRVTRIEDQLHEEGLDWEQAGDLERRWVDAKRGD